MKRLSVQFFPRAWWIPLVAAFLLSAGVASAAQPPMTEQEIDEHSDTVVIADVIGVACHGNEDWGNSYGAWLQVREVLKGNEFGVKETILVRFVKLGPLSGGVEVLMYPGQRLKLYLRTDNGLPEAWHQDGKHVIVDVPNSERVLPKQPGEIRFASTVAKTTASKPQGAKAPAKSESRHAHGAHDRR